MFFKKIKIKKLYPNLDIKNDYIIADIKPLRSAKKNDLTFFESIKYKLDAGSTKATSCITTEKLEKFLPKRINKIIVKNVFFELSQVINKIYLKADIDYPDESLNKPKKVHLK